MDKKLREASIECVQRYLQSQGISYTRLGASADTWGRVTVEVHGATPSEAERMQLREAVWLDSEIFVQFHKF